MPFCMGVLRKEARRAGVLAPVEAGGDRDVPQVDQGVDELNERQPVSLQLKGPLAEQVIHAEADGQRRLPVDGVANCLDRLAEKA